MTNTPSTPTPSFTPEEWLRRRYRLSAATARVIAQLAFRQGSFAAEGGAQ